MEEEWTPNSKLTFFHHTLAGSMAGLAEHVVIFPIDTLKTHVQCERCGTSSWNCATKIIRREGLLRLWRGVGATFAGCIPAHAAYFSVYEKMKILVGADNESHHPIQAAMCGASASFSHDVFMTPLDTIKQRMQLGYYKNFTHCLKTIISQEGVRALYLSFPTTVLMNLPYGCIMVATNESMKKILTTSETFNLWTSMLSGSIAGAVAAACTNPLDVIKTRMQTQNLPPCPVAANTITTPTAGFIAAAPKGVMHDTPTVVTRSPAPTYVQSSSTSTLSSIKNVQKKFYSQPIAHDTASATASPLSDSVTHRHTLPVIDTNRLKSWSMQTRQVLSTVLKEDGYMGFARGIGPRMIVHAPSVAISWTVYEGIKHVLESAE